MDDCIMHNVYLMNEHDVGGGKGGGLECLDGCNADDREGSGIKKRASHRGLKRCRECYRGRQERYSGFALLVQSNTVLRLSFRGLQLRKEKYIMRSLILLRGTRNLELKIKLSHDPSHSISSCKKPDKRGCSPWYLQGCKKNKGKQCASIRAITHGICLQA